MEKSRRYSKQRQLIMEAVLASKSHPTADEVYHLLKPDHPELSLGTVYRNLNLLAEMKVIDRIGSPYPSERFDGRRDPHLHMVCQNCGHVLDVEMPPEQIQAFLDCAQSQTGNHLEGAAITLFGMCEQCQKNQKETADESAELGGE